MRCRLTLRWLCRSAVKKRAWDVKAQALQTTPIRLIDSWKQLVPLVTAILLVVGIVIGVVVTTRNQGLQFFAQEAFYTAVPQATARVTATLPVKASPTSAGLLVGTPVPLWKTLEATYTPTPLYIATKHNNEAFQIAMRALGRGELDKALTNFYQAVTTEPNAPDLYYQIGETYRQQGQLSPAGMPLTRHANCKAVLHRLTWGLARTAIESSSSRWQEAETNLEKAIELDPQMSQAYLELAHIALAHDDPQTALDRLQNVPAEAQQSPFFYFYRAQAKLALNLPEDAVSDARQANQMDVTLLECYRLLGESLIAPG